MSEKQTKNTKDILSNIRNWENTEDWWRRAIPNPHPIMKENNTWQTVYEHLQEFLNECIKPTNIGIVIFFTLYGWYTYPWKTWWLWYIISLIFGILIVWLLSFISIKLPTKSE